MKPIFYLGSLVLFLTQTLVNAANSPFVVGGYAPNGDANAWVEQKSNMLQTHALGDTYFNKVLPVAPASSIAGSFPVCASMILMYHNDQLPVFPETTDFSTAEALSWIASREYYQDYWNPNDEFTAELREDKSGPLGQRSNNHITRPNNCIADYCMTSQSFIGLRGGWTLVTRDETVEDSGSVTVFGETMNWEIKSPAVGGALSALETYVRQTSGNASFKIESYIIPFDDNYSLDTWEIIKTSIDANRPLIGLFYYTDDYPVARYPAITIVGYADDGSNQQAVAAYMGESEVLQWYFAHTVLGLVTFDFDESGERALEQNAVHRFYNVETGAYFFTAFLEEVNNIIANLPSWVYQGPVFRVQYGQTAENLPVYRFYNTHAGAHFYTMNEQEKESVIANLSDVYKYEGIAFFASPNQVVGQEGQPSYYPIWRCYIPKTGSHYFTGSEEEVKYIQEHVDPSLIYVEGIAWYSEYIYDI